mgnify:CR=1 FL=1
MKKMRKFAWIFMAAMTVAGFSACSNSEDEDLPTGGDGGEGGNPSTPSVVVKDTIYQFNNIEADLLQSMSCARVGLTRLFPRLTMTVHGKARFLQVRQMAR